MPLRRSISRSAYDGLGLKKLPRRGRRVRLLLPCLLFLLACVSAGLYLRALSRDIAISDARDAVTLAVNGCVSRMMEADGSSYSDFVTLEKDAAGNITAITTDTQRINALSARIMQEIARAADSETLDIRIPLGSLLGSNLLMGRGPRIPVQVKMLTSSFVRYDNALVATGINQSRHTLKLVADVDVDIMIPLATIHTAVETDILIAETVIVGRVPETYVEYNGGPYGSK